MTLYDVARLAGVSQPTASRVLNGSDRQVSSANRERVLRAARELAYVPNASAQAFVRGSSKMIAFVVGRIDGTYFSSMAAALMREARSAGYWVSIAVTDRQPERELRVVRELRAQRPRAIVFAGSGFIDPTGNEVLADELSGYERAGGKVLLISRTDLPFERISFDNRAGAEGLGQALAGLGYQRALVLGSETPLLGMLHRVEGFSDGFAPGTVEVRQTALSWEGGRDVVERMPPEQLSRFDLVVGVTDEMALGVMAALRVHGRRVPDDIAVAGFNDIRTLRDVSPPLTTVHVPLDLVAEAVVRRAIAGHEEGSGPPIPTHPVLRESTPPHH
ncbi:MAG: LacI family transcriptional regulator [Propionibacteriaceae bacterium]|nr:LacI family transcriptional regulator [Propionibacteriaceae bacterium]